MIILELFFPSVFQFAITYYISLYIFAWAVNQIIEFEMKHTNRREGRQIFINYVEKGTDETEISSLEMSEEVNKWSENWKY